jgi:hypothetical protein
MSMLPPAAGMRAIYVLICGLTDDPISAPKTARRECQAVFYVFHGRPHCCPEKSKVPPHQNKPA